MHERLYSQPDLVPDFNRLNPSPTAPYLIGLSGYARAGKDTVAEVITRLYGHQRVSFAEPLKRLAYEVDNYVGLGDFGRRADRLGATVDNLGWEQAKENVEVRRILQALGTKCREILGQDVWVDAAFDTLGDGTYVFSDCRFPNEAKAIKDAGGTVLRVVRPGVNALNDHISEIGLDGWDFDGIVMNDGGVVDLEGEVQRVLGEFE